MENVIDILSKAHWIKVKIEKLTLEYEEYQRRADSIPGPSYGERIGTNPNRNTDAPFVKWIYKAIETEEKIKKLKDELPKAEAEAIDLISKLSNEDYRLVLIYRYLNWMSWDEIANKIYYSNPTIRRWHSLAIEELKKIHQNKENF